MEFQIDKGSELPIYQQLKEQVKYFMLSGGLKPGDKLPPPKDLAGYLRINRNTVIVAYKELEKEGLIVTKHGQGTYLAENLPALPGDGRRRELVAVAAEAIERAKELGFSARDLFTVVYGQAVLRLERGIGRRLLFVECNRPDLDFYVAELSEALGVEVTGCLVAELPEMLENDAVRSADLWVTTFFHVEDVKALAEAAGKEVFAVMVSPALDILMQLGQLPAGTKVGLVCAVAQGAESMRGSLAAAGIDHVEIACAGLNEAAKLEALLGWADVVVSSRMALAEAGKLTPKHRVLLNFAECLDKAGVRLLKDYLAERASLRRGAERE
ncbi:MAG TPA: GntR family transcriptional regulator [Selenomonadales bacterium]|nr:GntR family transcriptional regulator [Selenomonadales bacterium]